MIAIIKGCGNNIASVVFALQRLNQQVCITDDIEVLEEADQIILAGVGHAATVMKKLRENNLDKIIPAFKKPVLGICLGMQLLYEHSEEGDTECLGIIPGNIKKLPNEKLIIPHMGWNTLHAKHDDMILNDISSNYTYFVHSYYAPINEHTVASSDYGQEFTAIVKYKNFYGMQFHPEKSAKLGAKLLSNFIGVTCK
jgi:glutamine amidotransferase